MVSRNYEILKKHFGGAILRFLRYYLLKLTICEVINFSYNCLRQTVYDVTNYKLQKVIFQKPLAQSISNFYCISLLFIKSIFDMTLALQEQEWPGNKITSNTRILKREMHQTKLGKMCKDISLEGYKELERNHLKQQMSAFVDAFSR